LFHLEASISEPQLDLGSKSHQILTLARARSIWDFGRWAEKQELCRSIFLTHSTLNLYVKAHQKMTQRPIVAYLSLKGMSAREIHNDIVATLGPDTVLSSSVTRYLREARFPPSKPEPHPADVQTDFDDSDQAILATLEDSRFVSVQQLSRLAHLPSTTVDRRPTQSLGFVAHHLRWVPHALSDAQKGERVNLSRRLLRMVEAQRDRAWYDITSSPSTSLGLPEYGL
jgi:hypothetical protein